MWSLTERPAASDPAPGPKENSQLLLALFTADHDGPNAAFEETLETLGWNHVGTRTGVHKGTPYTELQLFVPGPFIR